MERGYGWFTFPYGLSQGPLLQLPRLDTVAEGLQRDAKHWNGIQGYHSKYCCCTYSCYLHTLDNIKTRGIILISRARPGMTWTRWWVQSQITGRQQHRGLTGSPCETKQSTSCSVKPGRSFWLQFCLGTVQQRWETERASRGTRCNSTQTYMHMCTLNLLHYRFISTPGLNINLGTTYLEMVPAGWLWPSRNTELKQRFSPTVHIKADKCRKHLHHHFAGFA